MSSKLRRFGRFFTRWLAKYVAALPSPDGTAEVGYSIVPEFQRQGYAPEATKALIAWAFGHPQVTRVIAHTLPELQPSIRVMEKNGFTFTGAGEEPGTIRYDLTREDWQRREEVAEEE
ncbi:MAG TPA: GNAT family protein [Candidatus Angelobacter sp.]|nr:GNAT family protein [Candidatus Angelobacter sp.]